MNENFPSEWDTRKLEDICEMHKGRSPMPKSDDSLFGGNIPYIKIGDMTDNKKYVSTTEDTVTEKGKEESRVFDKNTLVIAIYGATRGKLCILDMNCCTHEGIVGFTNLSDDINVEFLYYFLKSLDLNRRGHGGAQKNLNIRILKPIEVPVPPLDEQERIVSVVEERLERVERLEKTVENIGRLADEYETSIMRHLFRNKELDDKTELSIDPDENSLPDDWEIVEIGDIGSFRNGKFLAKKDMSEDGEYPVYGGNGIISYYDDYWVNEESIVIGRVGMKCGTPHMADSKIWATDNSIVFWPDSTQVDREYAYKFLKNYEFDRIRKESAQSLIAQRDVKKIKIPLPPLDKQRQIVEDVNTTDFSELRRSVSDVGERFDEYRNSVLSYAFKGNF